MEVPRDIDSVLKRLLASRVAVEPDGCALSPEDEAYLTSMIEAIRSGSRGVLVVEDSDERLKFMFSNASRAEAISMLGKVIEATGRRIAEGDE
ncbi:MAG: hypothetical protein ACLQPV_00645 [Vulcanimicrobiaceae bacterium]